MSYPRGMGARQPIVALLLAAGLGAPAAFADGAFPDELSVMLPEVDPNRILVGANFGLVVSPDDTKREVAEKTNMWLAHGTAPTEACPGPGIAAPGYLCVYERLGEFRKPDGSISPVSTELGHAGSNAYGFIVFLDGEDEKLSYSYGSWTVTAP